MTTRNTFTGTLFTLCLIMLTLGGLSVSRMAGQTSSQIMPETVPCPTCRSGAGQTSAEITPESLPCPTCRFGMVGITRGQTVRLNVVNSADIPPGPCRTIGDDVPPGPCRQRVDLLFLDSMGRTLARITETLTAGRATFLDFDSGTIERAGNRLEIRPLVLVPPPDPDRSFIIASAEVFNTETGKTVLFVPPLGSDLSSTNVTSTEMGH